MEKCEDKEKKSFREKSLNPGNLKSAVGCMGRSPTWNYNIKHAKFLSSIASYGEGGLACCNLDGFQEQNVLWKRSLQRCPELEHVLAE